MYETHTKNTYQEFKKFSNALLAARFFNVFVPLLALILVVGLALLIINHNVSVLIGELIGCAIAVPMCFIMNKVRVKRVYDSNRAVRNETYKILFNEDALEVKSQNFNLTIPYKDLHKIIETKTNFYLMAAENQGVIIIKANCNKKLIDFIRSLS